MRPFVFLPLFTALVTASFNLNTSGPDWDYVAKDLANTTSQNCKDAYSANIDCDITLLGLVASMRPAFKPTTTDIDNTCTMTCSDSLAAYAQGVKDACTADGDKAQESRGGAYTGNYILDPVEIVGEIFQYQFAQSCRKASNGTSCRGSSLANADSFDCDDSCTAIFYQNAHDYPASDKQFNYYWLISRTDWWIEEFQTGWERLEKCGIAVGDTSSGSSVSGTAPSTTTSGTATATGSQATRTTEASEQRGTTTTTVSLRSTSTGIEATTTTNAGHSLKPGYIAGAGLVGAVYIYIAL